MACPMMTMTFFSSEYQYACLACIITKSLDVWHTVGILSQSKFLLMTVVSFIFL